MVFKAYNKIKHQHYVKFYVMLSSSYVLIKFTHQEITWNYDILRSARWSLSRIITISLVKILRVLAVTIENIEVQVNYTVSPSIFNFKYPDIFTFSNYNYLPTIVLIQKISVLIWTEYREILRISPYSVLMRNNVDMRTRIIPTTDTFDAAHGWLQVTKNQSSSDKDKI